ncbi:MAG: sigma-70 family RNA polymerase sigma factor [Pseudomonadota bacterium]
MADGKGEFHDDTRDEAIAVYAREFGPALHQYFRKRGAQPATCEDLAQQVFLRLLARTSQDEIDNPRGYIMQTASSVWTDHWRKRSARPDHSHETYDDVAHSPEGFSAERVLIGREALDCFAGAIAALPDRTRQIYLLGHVDGMKRGKLAKRMGLSVSAVDKHLMAARKAIGKAFGDQE